MNGGGTSPSSPVTSGDIHVERNHTWELEMPPPYRRVWSQETISIASIAASGRRPSTVSASLSA